MELRTFFKLALAVFPLEGADVLGSFQIQPTVMGRSGVMTNVVISLHAGIAVTVKRLAKLVHFQLAAQSTEDGIYCQKGYPPRVASRNAAPFLAAIT